MEVSIVIPVYNRAEMVKDTLHSVVGQTHRPIHLVLVDNNSADHTLSVLQDFKHTHHSHDFKVDVIQEPTSGACAARNSGLQLVKSEWVMFFDSDDTMHPRLVEKYVSKIEECRGEVDIITTNVLFCDGERRYSPFFATENYFENHIFHGLLSTTRFIVRRDLVQKVGLWNNAVKCWNDWELGIRLLLSQPRVQSVTDGIYVHVNVHSQSITGADYSSHHERREHALSVAIAEVEKSHHPSKHKLLRLLKARRFVLAGLYLKEGNANLAQEYYRASLADVKGDTALRILAPIIYRYVGIGGRGIDRLIRFVVKK